KQFLLQAMLDGGHRPRDLAGYEGFAAGRTFMVEQNAVRRMHSVSFAVIHRDPMRIEFCCSVGRARIKWRCLRLRKLCRLAEQLGCRRMIKAGLAFPAEDTKGL